MNILIIKLSAIGDVVHTIPVIPTLHEHFPQSKITWLVEEKAAGILKGYPGIDRLIISKRQKWLQTLLSPKCLRATREIAQFVKELRTNHYDLIIDFQGLFKSGILVFLSLFSMLLAYHYIRLIFISLFKKRMSMLFKNYFSR
jgi:3-deoxy-D-manno-octulosonic-acid transferase/heptosyltransferase-1